MRRAVWMGVTLCVLLSATRGGAQTIDLKAAADAIVKADEAFNQSVQEGNFQRFLSLIAERATFGGGGPNEAKGREAIGKQWARFFEKDGPKIVWKPTRAEALGEGDVGFSTGTSEMRVTRDGVTRVFHGNYVTVWQKQPDGSWQAIYDTGSSIEVKQ